MNTSGINSDLCIICNEPETNMHLFYFCKKVRGLYNFLLKICESICNTKIVDPFAFLFFDFRVSKLYGNACSLVNSSYIGLLWTLRNESIGIRVLKRKLVARIRYNTQTILMSLKMKEDLKKLFIDLDNRCENLIYQTF